MKETRSPDEYSNRVVFKAYIVNDSWADLLMLWNYVEALWGINPDETFLERIHDLCHDQKRFLEDVLDESPKST